MTHASADRVQTLRTRLRPGKRVLIVGAGISGLSAAYLLKQSCPEAELCVIDRAPRAGGVIQSERTREGLLLETGPDSLVTWKPEAMSLLGQLGLDQRTVVGAERRSWVKLRDRFAPMPDGLQGTLPPSPSAVLRGSLFSYAGKLRMACEPCVPARRDGLEESVQDFVTRRFGAEALAAARRDLRLRSGRAQRARRIGLVCGSRARVRKHCSSDGASAPRSSPARGLDTASRHQPG